MKNAKGVSIVSVIITIIVIIVLASITIYSGHNMLRQAKEDRAYDRLDVIYQAIKANEDILEIDDETDSGTLANDSDVYSQIGLDQFTKDKDMPTITYDKRVGGITDITNTSKRTYTLNDGTYEKKYEYDIVYTEYSTNIDFDMIAGINRPQLTEDMQAISYMGSSIEEVQDIYKDRWYSYDSLTPNYANMRLNGKEYVWIPRFAYKIQEYYKEKNIPNIPESAISIIFINGTGNRDANGNEIPNTYVVHPAFTYGDYDLAGIWVEKTHNLTSSNISNECISNIR